MQIDSLWAREVARKSRQSYNLCTGTPRNSGLRETEEKQKLNIAYQMFHLTNDRVKWRLTVSNMS